jgi:hypothetical protein
MMRSPTADEAVVSDRFARDSGYDKPADAVGKTIEFLAPENKSENKGPKTGKKKNKAVADEEPSNFFGIPLDWEGPEYSKSPGLAARTFRIVGVLNTEVKEGAGQGGIRGLMPSAGIYIPLRTAQQWSLEHPGQMDQVELALARGSGAMTLQL